MEAGRPLTQYAWCPNKRGQAHTGRKPRQRDGRDWSDVSTSQGTPRTSREKLGERPGTEAQPGGANPADTLTSDFQPPEP